MKKDSKIYIAGHKGLVGSSILRILDRRGYSNLIVAERKYLNLDSQLEVNRFFDIHKPEYVFLAAAKVGGIMANNNFPADFIHENLKIQSNIIEASSKSKIKRLIFLGSSCIYPKDSYQPIKEEYLLSGPLESTNAPYSIAKIAGIELCRAYNRQLGTKFLSVMPSNLYGPGDNYNLLTGHALPSLIRKFHEAKVNNLPYVEVWGTGKPKREFLYVEDLALALIFLMKLDEFKFESILSHEVAPGLINVGYGKDESIRNIAQIISETIGYDGKIVFNKSFPDGTFQKLLDNSKITSLGWVPETSLKKGISLTYKSFLENPKPRDIRF